MQFPTNDEARSYQEQLRQQAREPLHERVRAMVAIFLLSLLLIYTTCQPFSAGRLGKLCVWLIICSVIVIALLPSLRRIVKRILPPDTNPEHDNLDW